MTDGDGWWRFNPGQSQTNTGTTYFLLKIRKPNDAEDLMIAAMGEGNLMNGRSVYLTALVGLLDIMIILFLSMCMALLSNTSLLWT